MKETLRIFSDNFSRQSRAVRLASGGLLLLGLGAVGYFVISPSSHLQAAADNKIEAEASTLYAPALVNSDSTASGGRYLQFGLPAVATATPTLPPVDTGFQPTAPYYAIFYYPWFHNPTVDGAWSYWSDANAVGGSHSPPANWFSNFLPDPNPNQFSPATELYSSNDYTIFKWQLAKMAEAKQTVGISSWWGQGHKTDVTFRKMVTDFMNRTDNPYPNFRWALYYEKESMANPSVAELTADLNYLKNNYAAQSSMLKINGKPVVFVFADAADGGSANTNCVDPTDTSMTHRWSMANAQTGNAFYINLKVFSGYGSTSCQPDSWHQYAPSSRVDAQGNYAYSISPGFWKDGETPRLARSTTAFDAAVKSMVTSSAVWKLTISWNEWGEGSGIEPADEVVQTTGSGTATLNSNPTQGPFKNTYIDILNRNLPAI